MPNGLGETTVEGGPPIQHTVVQSIKLQEKGWHQQESPEEPRHWNSQSQYRSSYGGTTLPGATPLPGGLFY